MGFRRWIQPICWAVALSAIAGALSWGYDYFNVENWQRLDPAKLTGLPANRPTTAISAALNKSCRIPESIKGIAYLMIFPNKGPFVMSISYFLLSDCFLPIFLPHSYHCARLLPVCQSRYLTYRLLRHCHVKKSIDFYSL